MGITSSRAPVSRARRVAFVMWVSVLSAALGIGFFGVTSLVLAWFGGDDPAIPVTEVGYGALLGIIITTGVLVQVRAPERKIARVQQACWPFWPSSSRLRSLQTRRTSPPGWPCWLRWQS